MNELRGAILGVSQKIQFIDSQKRPNVIIELHLVATNKEAIEKGLPINVNALIREIKKILKP
jgi:hypothetical protein